MINEDFESKNKKDLVELLGPFMSKKETSGCLYKDLTRSKEIKVMHNSYGDTIIMSRVCSTPVIHQRKDCVILGHYEFSAVLKYIYFHGYETIPDIDNPTKYLNVYKNFDDDFKLPLKPLEFFSKKEEKDLIKILKYIKKQYDLKLEFKQKISNNLDLK